VDAACAFLEQSPTHVGVEGPVSSPPYDPLRGHSLANEVPGAYWTCNIAYTRDALERLQGFFEGFPAPHCEDLDLAFRALQLGEIGFAPEMRVTHHPRSLSTRQLVQRGALAPNEVLLFERHRSRYGRVARLPSVVFPLLNIATVWGGFVKRNRRTLITSPGRLIRSVAIAGGQLAIATQSLVAWRLRRARGR
jgi:GT2 family glycosyltransferase